MQIEMVRESVLADSFLLAISNSRQRYNGEVKIVFFDGEVEKFIRSLEKQTIAKVLRAIDLLEQFGHELTMPHSKKIGPRLFELRARGVQEVRVIYTFFQNSAILLSGFIKKTERISLKDLERAFSKLKELEPR